MDNNKKKLLILGGASQHIKVVQAAKELGLKTYVTDYLENSPAKRIADVSLLYDVTDVESIVQYCKLEKIDGVINTSLDPCQWPYQKICHELDVPCFGTEEQYYCLTNKEEFKNQCEKYGVNVIRTYDIQDDRDLGNMVFPVFVKPVDSRGSRGQIVCENKQELNDAVKFAKQESGEKRVIVEEYIKNAQDFTVAYLFVNGEAFLVRTGDRFLGTRESGLNNVCLASISPSKYTQMYIDKVNSKVINMLKGMGIKNGPVFMQGFICDGTVRFYDPGFRFSGGEYEQLLKKITGIDLIKYLVNYAINGYMENVEIPEDIVWLNGKIVLQLCPMLYPGKIDVIKGKEEICNMEEVITYSERYIAGERVPNQNNVRRRYGEICAICDPSNMKRVIDDISEKLIISNAEGEPLICNKLNETLFYESLYYDGFDGRNK